MISRICDDFAYLLYEGWTIDETNWSCQPQLSIEVVCFSTCLSRDWKLQKTNRAKHSKFEKYMGKTRNCAETAEQSTVCECGHVNRKRGRSKTWNSKGCWSKEGGCWSRRRRTVLGRTLAICYGVLLVEGEGYDDGSSKQGRWQERPPRAAGRQ